MSSHNQYDKMVTYDPQASVFVAANAGSGKTTLLVERVLSLLLNGTAAHKILCLTFTNAAAAEMQARVVKTLGKWVMMDDASLRSELEKICAQPIENELMTHARSLFAQILDAPISIRLQTIHGFCGSLLARFPLEAGVGLHLSVLDDHSQKALMQQAQMNLFEQATHDAALSAAIFRLVQALGEFSLFALFRDIVSKKQKLFPALARGDAAKHVYNILGVNEHESAESIIERYRTPDAPEKLKVILEAARTSDKATDKTLCNALQYYFSQAAGSANAFWAYYEALVTQTGTARKNIPTKDVSITPELREWLAAEQEKIIACASELYALRNAELSSDLLFITQTLLASYEQLKSEQGLLDFDDQILSATHLLTRSGMAAWVLFKLDGGIEHLLVDEAQDTSAAQWKIVRALTDEFLSGQGSEKGARSLFVVGDEKQSIFSFQDADPSGFAKARKEFGQRLDDALLPHYNIALTHSYRSAPEILQMVDSVFANPLAANGLTLEEIPIAHHAKRETAKGYVSLWPLHVYDADRERHGRFTLANEIASTIKQWLDEGAYLPAKGRNVQAGDIMVLVRKRSGSVMFPLARTLKRLGIPVAGVDRMNLAEEIAIHDLLAFARALLLPEDDLNLAALLKSPFFSMSEDTLLTLCHGREKYSLWQQLGEHVDTKETYQFLLEFRSRVDFVSPFEIFSELLDVRGMRRHITGRMGEEQNELLDEFLEQALLFERSNTPSMQGFLRWMEASDSDIKRDMEAAGGNVRIMTAHGAKGLQAPIVFVADHTSTQSKSERLVWCDNLPILPYDSKHIGKSLTEAKATAKTREMNEYRRLLYVALTRAEDWLLICGSEQRKDSGKASDDSWYMLCRNALERIGTPQGEGFSLGTAPEFKGSNTIAVSPTPSAVQLPKTAPTEPTPSKPLSPSKLLAPTPAQHKPLTLMAAAQRGNALHRIFQLVPQLPEPAWASAALRIAREHAPETDTQALTDEAIGIMKHPNFSQLFSPEALAEVPVCGVISWQGEAVTVSGQIDRLWIGEHEVHIVDFKSGATPPAEDRIPDAYVHQMALYRALLQQIYPTHSIRCGLLWTASARLDWITPKHLDEVPACAYI